MVISVKCKARYSVQRLLLNPDTSYEIGPFGRNAIVLRLVANETKESVALDVSGDFKLIDSRERMLFMLEEGQLPPGSKLDSNDKRVSPEGKFDPDAVLRLDYLPTSLQEFYHHTRLILYEAASHMLRLLRWRYAKQAPFELRSESGLLWEAKAKG